MPSDLEFLSPTDKPALLALHHPESLEKCKMAASELNYRVHAVQNHPEFTIRFTQVSYHLVILDELFDSAGLHDNPSLQLLQNMPMIQRRHAVIFLVGDSFQTLNPLQAFQQSVHAVIHPSDLKTLSQILLKFLTENDLFLKMYRDATMRVAHGKG